MDDTTTDKISFGEKIKFYRKRSGLSQAELEVATDLGPGTVCRFEKNITNPTKETIIKIATALELDPKDTAYLLGINIYNLRK